MSDFDLDEDDDFDLDDDDEDISGRPHSHRPVLLIH